MNPELLIEKAKAAKDEFEAESWMLVGKALGKGSYESTSASYDIYCSNGRAAEAAESFQKLYMGYNSEARFWEEVKVMLNALKSHGKIDAAKTVKKEVFGCLHPQIQQSLLLDYAEKQTELESKSEAYLILLKTHPSTIAAFGIEFVRILREQKESRSKSCSAAENWCWQILVCRVVPVLLACKELPVSDSLCLSLLKEAIQFFASCVDDDFATLKTEIGSDFKAWDSLASILKNAGERMAWKRVKYLPQFTLNDAEHALNAMGREKGSDERDVERAFLALSILTWISHEYKRQIGIGSEHSQTMKQLLVYLPGRKRVDGSEAKKLKSDPEPKFAEKMGNSAVARLLSKAICCLDTLKKHHEAILDEIAPSDRNSALNSLMVDALIFSGRKELAIQRLNGMIGSDFDPIRVEHQIQLAACCKALGDSENACKHAIAAVELIGTADTVSEHFEFNETDENKLGYIPLAQMFPFAVRLLTMSITPEAIVKPKQTGSEDVSDAKLAHLIILLQLGWPNGKELLRKVVDHIVAKGSFSYSKLLLFLTQIDVLEEFAYLNAAHPKLDLKISDSDVNRKKGTRHSSKGARDEIRQLLEIQAAQTQNESEQALLLRFLALEKTALLAELA